MIFLIDCWVKIVLCDVCILHVDIAMAILFVFRGQLNFNHNLFSHMFYILFSAAAFIMLKQDMSIWM